MSALRPVPAAHKDSAAVTTTRLIHRPVEYTRVRMIFKACVEPFFNSRHISTENLSVWSTHFYKAIFTDHIAQGDNLGASFLYRTTFHLDSLTINRCLKTSAFPGVSLGAFNSGSSVVSTAVGTTVAVL